LSQPPLKALPLPRALRLLAVVRQLAAMTGSMASSLGSRISSQTAGWCTLRRLIECVDLGLAQLYTSS
jgi:hypothetical protein